MAHQFARIAFTPTVRALQETHGSRASYARMDHADDHNHRFTDRERQFIQARNSFYMASTSETGWPYVQHRGGPAGFVKVLDEKTIGFADFRGNRQYVSTGNLQGDERVSLIFMDYPRRRRLKLLGRAQAVEATDEAMLALLENTDYPAEVERAFVVTVEGFDWNCPQHITPRYTAAELEEHRVAPQSSGGSSKRQTDIAQENSWLGTGPLALQITGVRRLTDRVLGYELHTPDRSSLPGIEAGANIRVPVRLPNREIVDRQYSITSHPDRTDTWEIAVLREPHPLSASTALHTTWQLGTSFRTGFPENQFQLRSGSAPSILIAGGIGITPIKAMAHKLLDTHASFVLHYAGRREADMAYLNEIRLLLGDRLHVWDSSAGRRLPIDRVLQTAEPDLHVYTCGPDRLITAVRASARKQGLPRNQLHFESFS